MAFHLFNRQIIKRLVPITDRIILYSCLVNHIGAGDSVVVDFVGSKGLCSTVVAYAGAGFVAGGESKQKEYYND